MGEFTQNLLKLTEFPFSYSLMGLLALIFGHGINPEELSFAKIGPLLILMGFVATTLSICDPVRAIQRLIIKGREITTWKRRVTKFSDVYLFETIFGDKFVHHFAWAYLFAIINSPEDMKAKGYDMIENEPNQDRDDDLGRLNARLTGFKEQTVNTKWITAEVDRITALIYFIIVISVFIAATLLYPTFLQKFALVFQDNESTKLGILIFSGLALAAVSFMFLRRIGGLKRKAFTVFACLTALEAIKIDKENFRTVFDDIEHYLDNNEWTLAENRVDYIINEYTKLFILKVEAKEPRPFGVF